MAAGAWRASLLAVIDRCFACTAECFGPPIAVNEMFFGTGEVFEFRACSACGSLHLIGPPDDLSVYYPPEYLSFGPPKQVQEGRWATFNRKRLARFALTGRSVVGRLLSFRYDLPHWHAMFAGQGIKPTSRILDIGAGNGQLLLSLHADGFRNVLGVDAFIDESVVTAGVRIIKGELDDVTEEFDVAMLHHTLEHVRDPRALLDSVRDRLDPSGLLVICVPVVGGLPWREYRENWVLLDPPRHLFIPSLQGMDALASQCGFSIIKQVFQSSAASFWASMQNRQGIYLMHERSHFVDPQRSAFTDASIHELSRRAAELNERHDGDQAMFLLRPRA